MAIDRHVSAVLGVPVDAPADEIAGRLASLADAPRPRNGEEIKLWLQLERSIEEQLIRRPASVMSRTEAVHGVVSELASRTGDSGRLWWDVFADKIGVDPVPENNPDAYLRAVVSKHFLGPLADAGYFRLV
jgi:hypothetical protein